jgi:starch synthase
MCCPPSPLLLSPQKLVERGVAWPTPGSKFWERQPRLAPMPVDIGKGQMVIPPRDSRSLEIVHFTAELAPCAKVRGWRAC